MNEVLQGIQCHCHNFKAACAADFENFSLELCVNNHHSDDDPNEVIFFFFSNGVDTSPSLITLCSDIYNMFL